MIIKTPDIRNVAATAAVADLTSNGSGGTSRERNILISAGLQTMRSDKSGGSRTSQ